jgi:protein-tyrosine kinase
MSRIEEALEKAMELRELRKQEPREEIAPGSAAGTPQEYVVGESIVQKDSVDKHLVCITEPYSLVAEQYKKLRARILMETKKDSLNTLMITSSGGGEGKTITAINLAVTMAHGYDNTVLLVDADLRNSSVCRYLGITAEYGLSDVLAGTVDLGDVLIKTGIGKLTILPAGQLAENPAELLASEKMKRLIHEMKSRYKDRYVIFDTSPVLVISDSVPVAHSVDGTLVVVQAQRTSEKTLSQAISLLRGCKIFGVVLNDMPEQLSSALYPYYDHYKRRQNEERTNHGNGSDPSSEK